MNYHCSFYAIEIYNNDLLITFIIITFYYIYYYYYYRFDERKVMLWGGFFFMVIGRVLCIPWGPDPPKIANFGREYLFQIKLTF